MQKCHEFRIPIQIDDFRVTKKKVVFFSIAWIVNKLALALKQTTITMFNQIRDLHCRIFQQSVSRIQAS